VGTVTGYYDPDLTILSVSEPLLRGLGYTLDSFMARTGGSLRNMFYGEGASFLEPGRFPRISGRGEGRVLTSDGSPVNAELCKKDATDALGKPIWVMSVHLTWEHENLSLINEAISAALWYFDCDESKKAQMQAQRSAAFHRAFTDASLCEYYVNLEENTFDIFKVEPSLMTVFERSGTWDELVHHLVNRYVVEGDRQAVTDFYDRTYMAKKLKGLKTELSLECRIILDGEVRWIRNVIMRGEIDDSEYAMIFLRDITEAKEELARQQRVASDNASMGLLIQSMVRLVDRFVVLDLERDRYEFYSLQGEPVYKPTGAYHDFVAQVARKYKTLESLDSLEAMTSADAIRAHLTGEDQIYKFEYCTLGEDTYKIASFIPLEWEGGRLVKALQASMDVSQEKKAEIESRHAFKEAYRAAENANRAKTEFLSNMSHDIRTPMNAIIGLTAIAGANIDSQAKVVECLGKITKSSRHLLDLINEVLDMARIESGKITLAEEDFSLPELVDNLLTLTRPGIDAHGHDFEVHVNHIEHEAVCGDSLRIQQVFVNLMNGSIEVESAPDQGTKITVTIFLKLQENELGQERELVDLPVLVVDDDRTCCESTTGTLREIGIDGEWVLSGEEAVRCCCARHDAGDDYFAVILDWKMTGADVETAENGKEAVEKVENAPDGYYDLVFMDIQMPLMNGYEATAAIRAMPGERGKLPIVAMTANAFAEDVQLAKNAGMNEHVAKPLDMNKLNDVLGEWLG
jgi:CheY-like chemotaxis protein/PAS domain-containing protein